MVLPLTIRNPDRSDLNEYPAQTGEGGCLICRKFNIERGLEQKLRRPVFLTLRRAPFIIKGAKSRASSLLTYILSDAAYLMDTTSAIQIGLGVAVLLSFFASFLSAKTWKIGQVLLVFMVIVAAGFFWYLSAAALKIQASHGALKNKLEEQVAAELKTLQVLREGRSAAAGDEAVLAALQAENEAYTAGLRQLKVELHNATYGRGRVWTEVKPNAPAADGTTTVAIEEPTPHGLHPQSVVYVFEQGSLAEGAHYLGEFAVTEVGEGVATLAPAITLTPAEQERLNNSNANWIIYEQMPIDSHDTFAALSEDELRGLLPERSVSEYLKDGQPAGADDPAERVLSRKVEGEQQQFYQRRLRDYAAHFHELQLQFFVLQNLIEQKEKDNALLEQTVAKTNADIKVREVEVANLTSDLAHFQKEVAIVKDHLQKVSTVATRIEKMAKTLLVEVRQRGTELGQLQLHALEQVEKNSPAPPEIDDTSNTTLLDSVGPTTALVGP
jgi:hypothetical protein